MSLSRNWRHEWGLLALVALLALPLFTPRLYGADEVKYFVHLRSLWFDGDVDYANEYDHFIASDTEHFSWLYNLRDPISPTGRKLNDAPIGAAVLWAPFYIAADLLVIVARSLGATVPRDGYGWPYIWAACLGSLVWGIAGLALGYRMCRRFFDPWPSQLATIGIWFATPLVFYLYITPPMAHAASMFATTLFLWLWVRGRDGHRPPRQWLLLGAAAGLMVLVRELNWLLLLPLGVDETARILRNLRAADGSIASAGSAASDLWSRIPGYAAFFAALAVVSAPQFFMYWLLHGSPTPSPYVVSKFEFVPRHAGCSRASTDSSRGVQ